MHGALVFVFEERLVRAHHLGVVLQPRAHAGAQPNESVHALGGQEGIAQDLVGPLAKAIHPARALNQPDDGPRQVVVHHDGAILQVLPFAEHVGGDEHAQLVLHRVRLAVAAGAEAPRELGGVGGVAGRGGHARQLAGSELALQITHGVRELSEHQDLGAAMRFAQQRFQSAQLRIRGGVPIASLREHADELFGVAQQRLAQIAAEVLRRHPAEAAAVVLGEDAVDFLRAPAEGGHRP